MEQAKVFFTDFRCHPGVNQQQKLEKLLLAAGMDTVLVSGVPALEHGQRTGSASGKLLTR